MSPILPRLRHAADALEQSHTAAVEILRQQAPGVDPYSIVTPDGFPMLAPTLAALGQVLAAIAHLEGRS